MQSIRPFFLNFIIDKTILPNENILLYKQQHLTDFYFRKSNIKISKSGIYLLHNEMELFDIGKIGVYINNNLIYENEAKNLFFNELLNLNKNDIVSFKNISFKNMNIINENIILYKLD